MTNVEAAVCREKLLLKANIAPNAPNANSNVLNEQSSDVWARTSCRRRRDALECGLVLDGDHAFFRWWDSYTVLLLMYTAAFTPFQVAFMANETTESLRNDPWLMTVFVVDQMVNLSFMVDIMFNFMLTYYSTSGTYVRNQVAVKINNAIIINVRKRNCRLGGSVMYVDVS